MNSTQKLAISKEIERLLAIGCIKEVKRGERLFLSNIFTVPKKNGDLRLVINLKDLNQFLAFHHFKMESFSNSKGLDTGRGLDDKTRFERSLSFSSSDSRSSEIPCLPLGWQMLCLLCSSLWAGSCPMGVYKDHKTDSCSYPIESGDSLCYVSDNHLIFGKTKSDWLQKAKKEMTLLQELGFTINIKKSILRAHSADRVSGPNSGLNPDESVSPRTKGFRPD